MDPPKHARPDFPLDSSVLNRTPFGGGGPVVFHAKATESTFQEFMWDLVNALHIINLGLASFKKLRWSGSPPEVACKAYDIAYHHYMCVFKNRWKEELHDETTWLEFAVSTEGYITDVRVVSNAFSRFKPMQSSDLNTVHPYPSSSSSKSG